MSFSHKGRGGRSFGDRSFHGGSSGARSQHGRGGYNRSQQRNRYAQQRSSINPARYVNAAVESEQEKSYEIKHAFEDFGLSPALEQNVRRRGYVTPTPIQDQAIPSLMEGRDVVGLANTGTGKTAAFLLPLIHKVLLDGNQGVLILAPTRELALQIHQEFLGFAAGLKISVALCIGGANLERQVSTLRQNPHFVIGTPGRIKDLINRGAFDTAMFANIVLDEVDRMLDIGFINDIRFLISQLPQPRHSAFFSATMSRDVEGIMHALLTDPVVVSVKTRETSDHIDQDVIRVNNGKSKVEVLHELLIQKEFEKVIVFGRTKHGINKLEQDLSARGFRVSSIHGNKSQNARQRALDQFKRGHVQALLATDVAARGIDIDGVSHVINYDEPQSYEDYIHRIGRTGRAGKVGKALTFVG
jgi:superfamily II DNA/RNA helicase